MKTQIIVIHGGDTFASQEVYLDFLKNFEIDIERYKSDKTDWKPWLRKALGENYEVILPRMPNSTNAQYSEWKLWFEKLFPFLNEEVILIGHSLGASFVIKYLSENIFPKKLKKVFSIAAIYDKDEDGYSLESFSLPDKLSLQTEDAFLYHSKDDPIVPFSELELLAKKLPNAVVRIFEDRKHFNQEQFPELVEDIKTI